MSGSDKTGSTTTTAGPPQFPTELQPYWSQVGQRAAGAVQDPRIQLENFFGDSTLKVGTNRPLEQDALNQVHDRLRLMGQASRTGPSNQVWNPVTGVNQNIPANPQGLSAQVMPLSGGENGQFVMASTNGPQQESPFAAGYFLDPLTQRGIDTAGQAVGVAQQGNPFSQFYGQGLGSFGQAANMAGATSPTEAGGIGQMSSAGNPLGLTSRFNQGVGMATGRSLEEMAGLGGLSQFQSGNPMTQNSPTIQAALQGLENTILPQVQNQAARTGLAQSGQLPQEVARAYAGQLVPLFQQGLQQQQSAAQQLAQFGGDISQRGTSAFFGAGGAEQQNAVENMRRQLEAGQATFGAGNTLTQRGIAGQQALGQAQMGVGQQQQALNEANLNRYLQSLQGQQQAEMYGGQFSEQLRNQALQQALQGGGTEWERGQLGNEASLQNYLRLRETAANLFNPSGGTSLSSSTGTTNSKQSGGGFTVICSALYDQGYVDDVIYAADAEFGLAQDPEVLAGYHRWAIPVVRAMRRSKIISRLVATAAKPWIQEMAYRQHACVRGSVIGKVMMAIGIPICRRLGRNRVYEWLSQ